MIQNSGGPLLMIEHHPGHSDHELMKLYMMGYPEVTKACVASMTTADWRLRPKLAASWPHVVYETEMISIFDQRQRSTGNPDQATDK